MSKSIKNMGICEYFILFIYAGTVLVPLLLLCFSGFENILFSPKKFINLLIPSERTGILLLKSTGFAAAVSLSTLITGGWCGIVLFSIKSGPVQKLRWLILLSALIPPYIHAMAWSDVLSFINKYMTTDIAITGWGISILVQSMYFLPMAAVFTMVAIKSIPSDIIDAGKISQTEGMVFKSIILPVITPVMLVSSAVIFILSLSDYTIPSLFGVNIYSMEIYTRFAADNNPDTAFVTAVPLIIMTVAVVMCLKKFTWGKLWNVVKSTDTNSTGLKFTQATEYMAVLAVILVIIQIAVPILVITIDPGMWSDIFTTISNSFSEIFYSFVISTMAVVFSLPVSLVMANCISEYKYTGRLLVVLNIILFTLPSSLVGIGLLTTWNSILTDSLYNSLLLPVIALITRFMPLMVIILAVQAGTIEKCYKEAAILHTSDRFKILYLSKFKVMLPGITASSVLMFIMCMGELGASLLTMPPGTSTLTVKIYNYLHYGSTESVKGLCFTVLAFCITSGYIFISSSGLMKKIRSRRIK